MLARGRGLHLGKGAGQQRGQGNAGWSSRGSGRFLQGEGKANKWAVVGSRAEAGVLMALPGVGDRAWGTLTQPLSVGAGRGAGWCE